MAYVHTDGFNPERPLWIVTAAVDRIQMHSGDNVLPSDRDLVMQVQVFLPVDHIIGILT